MIRISKQAITQSLTLCTAIGMLAGGCKSEPKSSTSATDPAGQSGNAPKGSYPAEFAAWDMKNRLAAWQGAWSINYGGSKLAFEVRGNQATVVDETSNSEVTFTLESPCTAKFSVADDHRAISNTTFTYTVHAGKLITGGDLAGSRSGNTAVFCDGARVLTLDGATCLAWTEFFGKFTSTPAECGMRGDGEDKVFYYMDDDREQTVPIERDVIWSDELKRDHATPQADLAAAKAAAGL